MNSKLKTNEEIQTELDSSNFEQHWQTFYDYCLKSYNFSPMIIGNFKQAFGVGALTTVRLNAQHATVLDDKFNEQLVTQIDKFMGFSGGSVDLSRVTKH